MYKKETTHLAIAIRTQLLREIYYRLYMILELYCRGYVIVREESVDELTISIQEVFPNLFRLST